MEIKEDIQGQDDIERLVINTIEEIENLEVEIIDTTVWKVDGNFYFTSIEKHKFIEKSMEEKLCMLDTFC